MEHLKFEGELPDRFRDLFEDFHGLDNRETQINRLYEPHSVTFICMEANCIYGSARVIIKNNAFEKLPCEFAYASESLSDAAPLFIGPDNSLSIPDSPDLMPVAEAGGLKIDQRVELRMRSKMLFDLMVAIQSEWLAIGGKVGFVSCDLNPSLERLYVRNFQLEPAAVITYNKRDFYKLFYKWNTTTIPEQHSSHIQKGLFYGE